jgi:hypothetical protein
MQKGGSRMNERIRRWMVLGLAMSLLACAGLWSVAQEDATPEDAEYKTVIAILCHMSGHLRLVRMLASYAVLSPIRSDQRLYTQYVVNFLEGKEGKHYVYIPMHSDLTETAALWGISTDGPGLIESSRVLSTSAARFNRWMFPGVHQEQPVYEVKNIAFLLAAALEEAVLSLKSRSIEQAADHMRHAYAYAFTALGGVGTGMNPGSVTGLLVQLKRSPSCRPQPQEQTD